MSIASWGHAMARPNNARPARPLIFELREKMDFLMKHAVPRARIGADTPLTINALHTRSGIPLQSLQNAIGAENDYSGKLAGDGKLGIEHQSRIANLFGFEVGGPQNPAAWPEWHDWEADEAAPADSRRDTAQKFRDEYLRRYRASRVLGLRLISVRVKPSDASAAAPTLGSLELDLRQSGPGEPWPIGVEVICQPTPIGTFELGIKRALVSIDPGTAGVSRLRERLGSEGDITFKRGDRTITLRIANAQSGHPTWDIACDGKPIGVFRLDDEQCLCFLHDVAPDDEIIGTMKVWFKDLELADPDPHDDADDTSDPWSFVRADGKQLSATKRALIKIALINEELPNNGNGWLTVAADYRAFKTSEGSNA